MINEFKAYHGSAFIELIDSSEHPITIVRQDLSKNSLYEINDDICFYLKHSIKRISPWRFTFQVEHITDIKKAQKKYEEFFLVLVCGRDSIAVLNSEEVSTVLPIDKPTSAWVSVSTGHNRMLKVEGSSGLLSRRIRRTDPFAQVKKIIEG